MGCLIMAHMDGENQAVVEKREATRVFRNIAPLAAPLAFLFILLSLNTKLFKIPIVEAGDLAANSIQVQHAKVFHELLGNYSRWQFHHPGPAWFYLLAWGEYLFHDLLHLMPAPFNAQILTIILLNVFFIGAAFEIFRGHCPERDPFALNYAVLVLFICVVSRTAENVPLVSPWMPHVPLFCFLLFLVAIASVATNRIRDLPIATGCGGLLVHAHIAQILFVVGLAVAATCTLYVRNRKSSSWREFYTCHKKPILLSAAIAAIFSFPILAELFIDKPNNLQAVLSYEASHHGQLNSLTLSARYYLSFLAHVANPEDVLLNPSASLWRIALSRANVRAFWLLFLIVTFWGVLVAARRKWRIPIFIQFLSGEILFVSLLFLFWASRISGPLFNWNGFFVYSLQLLAFLIVISVVFTSIPKRLVKYVTLVALLLTLAGIFKNQRYFQNNYYGSDEVRLISERIPVGTRSARLDFEHDEWPVAVGVANQLLRDNRVLCVGSQWAFMFGAYSVCASAHDSEIFISAKPTPCSSRCSVIWQDDSLVAQLTGSPPYSPGSLIDFHKGGNAAWYEGEGWSALEDGGSWTLGDRSILLLKLPGPPKTGFLLTFKAHAFTTSRRPSFQETLRVNNSVVADWVITGFQIDERAWVPQSSVPSSLLRIEFLNHDPRSPAEFGPSPDNRKLGLSVEDLRVVPAVPEAGYVPGLTIDFRWGGNAFAYEREGWGAAEDGGSWALGKHSVLSLNWRTPPTTDLLLTVEAHAFTVERRPQFRETLRVNDSVVADWLVTRTQIEKRVRIPRALIRSGPWRIEFSNDDPRSPADLGLSTDDRKLGLAIETIKLEPIGG